jgi:hypothetical protein
VPEFTVACYEQGIWDGKTHQTVEAATQQEAAAIVCGASLVTDGKLGQLRAEVWNAHSAKVDRQMFYIPWRARSVVAERQRAEKVAWCGGFTPNMPDLQ